MFKKPFKIKSNNQIKTSDRKIIKDNLIKYFTNLSEENLNELLPKKEVIFLVKIILSNDETIFVYTIQKRPMFFDYKNLYYPTVYLLWKYPNLIPTFTIPSQVLPYISSGSDLMLPGVIKPPGPKCYGSLNKNTIASINLNTNISPIAVGVTAQSSYDMALSGDKGKCLIVYHFYGDKLCTLEGLPLLPVPNLGPPTWLIFNDNDFPPLGQNNNKITTSSDTVKNVNSDISNNNDSKISELMSNKNLIEQMDELLEYCFLVAIKYSKNLTLPILTSNFYKLQMLPQCPENKTLDIKKSSYKKLKPFLDEMSKIGLITIDEIKKGVESITRINQDHQKFAEFYLESHLRPKKNDENINNQSQIVHVIESLKITQIVLPIFSENGLKKGDHLRPNEVRKYITDYVKKHDCQDKINQKLIKPDENLTKISKTTSSIPWEELIEKILNLMTPQYKVNSGTDEIINKGKISPITMNISVRSYNKKVTIVDNLSLYGIRTVDFAKECQHGVAASTTITKPPGKNIERLLIQGNQILFVYNLLTEKYKIPQKYIKGLEYAPKKRR